MARLYRLAAKDLVLLDEKGKTQLGKRFITDDHPAFAGQRHKVVECDPATLGDELSSATLLGSVDSIEKDRGEKPDRMQRAARNRA